MGFLKKITRPISRVLDKIVPNEIKPALPFLAAAAPFFGPTSNFMGTGIRRLLMGGGANLLGQLSQEGNEGEVNPLSLGLATLSAGMTDPGAANYLQGLKYGTPEYAEGIRGQKVFTGLDTSGLTGFQKTANQALDLGITGVDKLQGLQKAVADDGIMSKAGLKLASIPATQGAMDLGIAETRRFNKQQIIDDALSALEEGADSASRALAIRQSMEAYGFTEDEIVDTISAAGYRAGGRVGFDNGGSLTPTQQKMLDAGIGMFKGTEEIMESGGDPNFSGIKGAVESVDKNMRADRAGDFFRLRDEAIQKGDSDKIKEIESDFFREFGMVMPKMMAGGELEKNIFLQGGPTIERLLMNKEEKKQDKDKIKKELEELGIFKRKKVADGGIMNAKRGLVDEPGGYAGEKMNFYAAPLNNKIEGFNKQMMDEYLQGNYPEYEGERVSDFYNRPNFTDGSAVIKIIEMGGDFDDVRETLKIDISDERIKDLIRFDQEDKEKKSSENFYMKDGGLMNLGGKEMDLRKGGFVPIGKKERADDVPARLSKNEFVMTADAVRAAGGGSVNKGAKRMYDVMNKLEARA